MATKAKRVTMTDSTGETIRDEHGRPQRPPAKRINWARLADEAWERETAGRRDDESR